MRQIANLTMGIVMLLLVFAVSSNLKSIFNKTADAGVTCADDELTAAGEKTYTVVLDAGHGGRDGGKVSVNGCLEKDINLDIVMYIKTYLESAGVNVVLTRTDGNGLYQESDSNKKQADMMKRCSVIEMSGADCVVSVHQNSYTDESVSGAQVFYYEDSEESHTLARLIQQRFDYVLGNDNTRQEKANSDYYLLKNVEAPVVIVECGFLSNREEAARLESSQYQQDVAWTIYMGVMQYLKAAD